MHALSRTTPSPARMWLLVSLLAGTVALSACGGGNEKTAACVCPEPPLATAPAGAQAQSDPGQALGQALGQVLGQALSGWLDTSSDSRTPDGSSTRGGSR